MRARRKSLGIFWFYLDKGRQPDGTRPEIPLGNDYIEALRKYADIIHTASHAPPVTVPELLTKWQQETLSGRPRSTQNDIVWSMKNLCIFFSNPVPAPLSDVKPVHVAQYLHWRRRTAAVRANREIAWLSAAWNWGRETGMTTLSNPCDGVKRNKEHGRDIYVEHDEYDLIFSHADTPMREAMELAYLIGQRPSDLRNICETDIRGGCLTLQQSKTGAKVSVAVVGDLSLLVERIKARKATIVHGVRSLSLLCDESGRRLTKDQMRYRFNKARALAAAATSDENARKRLLSIQFRDFRAKAGTDVRDGSNLDAAQELLGHRNSAMTEHYTRKRKGKTVNPVR